MRPGPSPSIAPWTLTLNSALDPHPHPRLPLLPRVLQEVTNYYMDVEPSAFHGALDRLSQCLASPLCSQSALEREVNAVNNEFIGWQQADNTRREQLISHTVGGQGLTDGGENRLQT